MHERIAMITGHSLTNGFIAIHAHLLIHLSVCSFNTLVAFIQTMVVMLPDLRTSLLLSPGPGPLTVEGAAGLTVPARVHKGSLPQATI